MIALDKLSPTIRGMLWAVATGVIFTVLNTFLRHLAQQLDPTQTQFLRYSIGMLVMAPYANMTPEAEAAGKAAEADISSGKIVIFKGPIKDQSGAEKVPAGTALDDGAIAGMNWLADGIDGQIPS